MLDKLFTALCGVSLGAWVALGIPIGILNHARHDPSCDCSHCKPRTYY
jgi:hypothetical protein